MRMPAVLLALSWLIGACGVQSQGDTRRLKIGAAELKVHVVATHEKRASVIRDHAKLPEDQAVLLCFPRARYHHLFSAGADLWRDPDATKIDIATLDYTVAFLDKDGKVGEVRNLLRGDPRGITSTKETPYALIVGRAWAEKHPIKELDTILLKEVLKDITVEDPPQIRVKSHTISLELVANNNARNRGLMFRDRMSEEDGMLFIYPTQAKHGFWMKNTVLPLTLAYIRSDGTISSIHDLTPGDEKSVDSTEPVRFVLEMNRGWFKRHAVEAGDKITLPESVLSMTSEE